MQRYKRMLIASAVILAAGAVAASAHQSTVAPMMQQGQPQITQQGATMGLGMMGTTGAGVVSPGGTMMGPGMMMGAGMMGPGMMGDGASGFGMMGPNSMRMMVIMMDVDGDGAVSLAEFQALQERMFNAMDADGDGRLTEEEAQALMMQQPGQVQ